jgi:hypothetical protein
VIAEDRHNHFFPGYDELCEAAHAPVNLGAIGHRGHQFWRAIESSLAARGLTAKALEALATLSGDDDHHSVAWLDALNHRANFFDDPDRPVTEDKWVLRRCFRIQGVDDGVAGLGGFYAGHDLAGMDRI